MNHFDIDVQCEVAAAASLKEAVRKAAESTLDHESVPDNSALTLLLTDDAKLRQLNHDFLGIDKPTDVLSFPSGDSWSGLESYLGDIAISLPTAEVQAATAGHDVGGELTLLAVHGVLHLLGYDHATDEDRNRMSMIQAEIIEQLAFEIADPFPTS